MFLRCAQGVITSPHAHGCISYLHCVVCRAAAWSKYNIAVSSRRENESYSCTDYFDAHNPSVGLVSSAAMATCCRRCTLIAVLSIAQLQQHALTTAADARCSQIQSHAWELAAAKGGIPGLASCLSCPFPHVENGAPTAITGCRILSPPLTRW